MQEPDDAEVQRFQLVVEHLEARSFEITGIDHLVLEAHQRTVELRLKADAEERVIAIVFECLACGRPGFRW